MAIRDAYGLFDVESNIRHVVVTLPVSATPSIIIITFSMLEIAMGWNYGETDIL